MSRISFTSGMLMPHVADAASPMILASIPVVLSWDTPFAAADPESSSLPDAVSVMACAAVSRRHISVHGPASV